MREDLNYIERKNIYIDFAMLKTFDYRNTYLTTAQIHKFTLEKNNQSRSW